jgi:hypothetical protein
MHICSSLNKTRHLYVIPCHGFCAHFGLPNGYSDEKTAKICLYLQYMNNAANSAFTEYESPNEIFPKPCLIFYLRVFPFTFPKVQAGLSHENCNRTKIHICTGNTVQRCRLLTPALGVALYLNCYLSCCSYKALRHLIICFKRLTTAGVRA